MDIVATGPNSRGCYVLVHGVSFETDLPDSVWVLFDHRVVPKVYAYLVVHWGRGVVSACYTRWYRVNNGGFATPLIIV